MRQDSQVCEQNERQMTETMVNGYLTKEYADSLCDTGTARELPNCKGWIIERSISGTQSVDATGCYPVFACQDWSGLKTDIESLEGRLVSLSLVSDPFGDYSETLLKSCFPDVCRVFKDHLVADLQELPEKFVDSHHRRYARKALTMMQVEVCDELGRHFDDWVQLYSVLTERHGIKGVTAFSRESFRRQFAVPGLVVFRAVHESATVGMLLWYIQGNVAYYHLGAYNMVGYKLRASFALFWSAMEWFGERNVRWLGLGAGAGLDGKGTDGLTRFKRGWANTSRYVYFCGRILNKVQYRDLVRSRRTKETAFFPVYRWMEVE